MDEPILCRVCDRLFDAGFESCPFCGAPRLPEESFEEIVQDSLDRVEATARTAAVRVKAGESSTLQRIEELLFQLNDMERDLDALLAQAESVPQTQS
jgi:RNA polymerase subunit RPABC4/transcription elongation factor Spt4